MNKKGFTLVEILIVVAILAVIAGIAAPQLKNILRSNLRGAAFQVASLSKLAYDSAVVKAKVHRIVFDIDQGNFKIQVAGSEVLASIKDDKAEKKDNKDKNDDKKEEFFDYP